jgi:hypothetical protein
VGQLCWLVDHVCLTLAHFLQKPAFSDALRLSLAGGLRILD